MTCPLVDEASSAREPPDEGLGGILANEDIPVGSKEEFIRDNPLEMAIYNFAVDHYQE